MSKAIEGEISDLVTTQTALGRALGLSQQRIGQLIDEGIVIRDETARNGQVMFFESVRNFFLSRKKTFDDETEPINFWKEKGLHEKAKRELSEIKLRKMRGEARRGRRVRRLRLRLRRAGSLGCRLRGVQGRLRVGGA